MSEATLVAEAPRRRIGAPPGHGRFPPVPPPPRWVRSEWEILDEQSGALGLTLWQALRDVLLWNEAGPLERRGLFRPLRASQQDLLARAIAAAPELADALRDLARLSAVPESADAARVAAACEAVWMWAEERGMRGTAIQFAEAAAKLEPKSSSRSYTAGRLCRTSVDHQRAVIWFRRAVRLARRAQPPSHMDRAIAHLGWGHLEHDRGNLAEAERHCWTARSAALRNGCKMLAGSAHHDLLGVCVDAHRYKQAIEHAAQALQLYKARHPRFPNLVLDIGVLWLKLDHFSCARYLLFKVQPWFAIQRDRILLLAALARSCAAVRDRVRFERACEEVLRLVELRHERSDTALYHVAEGARSFEQWDRAHHLATEALRHAADRNNRVILDLAERLVGNIASRSPGDVDAIPYEGSVIDQITSFALRKLGKAPAPEVRDAGAVLFPERYPVD